MLPYKFGLILMGMKQKKKAKKKIKMGDSKKLRFSKLPILKNCSQKLHRLVLGLVGLVDAKGIDVTQCRWLSGIILKTAKKHKKCIFSLF